MNDYKMYRTIFKEYPDIVSVKQMSEMLKINIKAAYNLLHKSEIEFLSIGRSYRIPKMNIIIYLQKTVKTSPLEFDKKV